MPPTDWGDLILEDLDDPFSAALDDNNAGSDVAEADSSARSVGQSSSEQAVASSPCWGFLISGVTGACTPGFSGKGRFAMRVCPACTASGIQVDAQRCRLITPAAMEAYKNPSSHGLWAFRDGLPFRVVNQTTRCSGYPIVIVRDLDAAHLLEGEVALVPPSYLKEGRLHLVVAKGTFVPTTHLANSEMAADSTGHGASASSSSSALQAPVPLPLALSAPPPPDGGSLSRSQEGAFKRARHETSSSLDAEVPQEGAVGQPATVGQSSSSAAETATVARESLLSLTSLHGQLTMQLQATLVAASGQIHAGSPALAEYQATLQRLIAPLSEATGLLQQLTSSLPLPEGGETPSAYEGFRPHTGPSFPPSPPVTSSTNVGDHRLLHIPMTSTPATGADADWVHNSDDAHGKPAEYFICDSWAVLTPFFWPLFLGQMVQRITRSRGACLTTIIYLGTGNIFFFLLLGTWALSLIFDAGQQLTLQNFVAGNEDPPQAHAYDLYEKDHYRRVFHSSFMLLVPNQTVVDWDELSSSPMQCKQLLYATLVDQARMTLGGVAAPTNQTEREELSADMLPFCAMMAYGIMTSQADYLKVRFSLENMASMGFLSWGVICFIFSLLIAYTRRREGIRTERWGPVQDILYVMYCLPCAVSWLIRTESSIGAGIHRQWSLLSPVGWGSEETAEILPVHM